MRICPFKHCECRVIKAEICWCLGKQTFVGGVTVLQREKLYKCCLKKDRTVCKCKTYKFHKLKFRKLFNRLIICVLINLSLSDFGTNKTNP